MRPPGKDIRPNFYAPPIIAFLSDIPSTPSNYETRQAEMTDMRLDYISVGGNRHPAAADWDKKSGLLAFGAGNNVALWDPLVSLV